VIADNLVADTLNTSYDYSSVLHYGKNDFSKNGLPTIEPIQSNIKIGQRYNLSNGDIEVIRRFYTCSSTGPTLPLFTVPIEPGKKSLHVCIHTYTHNFFLENYKKLYEFRK